MTQRKRLKNTLEVTMQFKNKEELLNYLETKTKQMMTREQIAAELGCSKTTLRKIFVKLGIELPQGRPAAKDLLFKEEK